MLGFALMTILQRIGDSIVLPFIHVTLVFMYEVSRNPATTRYLSAECPWNFLSTVLNTLLAS
jgi:hypothetical protein